jgi:hypothetical protein
MMLQGLNATDTTTAVDPAWYDIAGQFQSRYAEFNRVYAALQAQADSVFSMPQALQDEYTALMDRGSTVKSTIDSTMSDVNSAMVYLKSVFGIGFIQLLPAAVIGAGIAAAAYWLNSAYITAKKLDAFNAAIAAGGTVDQGLQAANNLSGGSGFLSAIGGSVGTIIVVMALILIVPKLLERR